MSDKYLYGSSLKEEEEEAKVLVFYESKHFFADIRENNNMHGTNIFSIFALYLYNFI